MPTPEKTLSDARFNALRAMLYTGHTNDMLLQWLQANGATAPDLNMAWAQMIAGQLGVEVGTFSRNDGWYTLLGNLGFTGSMNDREYGFWAAGGNLAEGVPVWGAIPLFYLHENTSPIYVNVEPYCYANPEVTTWGASVGTFADPAVGILTVSWADVGSVETTTAITLTATNAEGIASPNGVLTVVSVAGTEQSKPQFSPVPDFYNTEGIAGGSEVPNTRSLPQAFADGDGIDFNQYLIQPVTPDLTPNTWRVSGPTNVTIDAATGIVKGSADASPATYTFIVYVSNAVGEGATEVVKWEVLPAEGWSNDFTLPPYWQSGEFSHWRNSDAWALDQLGRQQTFGTDKRMITGVEYQDPTYTDHAVTYGITCAANGAHGSTANTQLFSRWPEINGLPDRLLNNVCGEVTFQIETNPIDDRDNYTSVLGLNGYTNEEPTFYGGLQVDTYPGATGSHMRVHCSLGDPLVTGYVLLDYAAHRGGAGLLPTDVVNVRFRKMDTEAALGESLKGWLYINGVHMSTAIADRDCSADFRTAITRSEYIYTSPNTVTLQSLRLNAYAYDDPTIEAWDHWTQPLPIITEQPESIRLGEPDGPISPPVPVDGDPLILFSDLADAPIDGWNTDEPGKGACVTIWGVNFGGNEAGTRPTGDIITVNGFEVQTAAGYGYDTGEKWAEYGKPIRWLQRISFFLHDQMGVGTGGIQLTVNGKTSNVLPFTTRALKVGGVGPGIIFYGIDEPDGGNGTHQAPYNDAGQWLFKNKHDVGDIIYVRGGLYSGQQGTTGSVFYGSGYTNTCPQGNMCAMVAYPNEVAEIRNYASDPEGDEEGGFRRFAPGWAIAKFKVDTDYIGIEFYDGYSGYGALDVGYGRIIGNDVIAGAGSRQMASAQIVATESGYKVCGNTMHGGRTNRKLDHCFYAGGATPSYAAAEFAYNYCYDNVWADGPHISVNVGQPGDRTRFGYNHGLVFHHNWIDVYQPTANAGQKNGRAFALYNDGEPGVGITNDQWNDPDQAPCIVHNNIMIADPTEISPDGAIFCQSHSATVENNLFLGFNGNVILYGHDPRSAWSNSRYFIRNNIIETSFANAKYIHKNAPIGSTEQASYNLGNGGSSTDSTEPSTDVNAPSGIIVDTDNFTVTLPADSPAAGQGDIAAIGNNFPEAFGGRPQLDWNFRPYTTDGSPDIGPVLAEEE